MSEILKDEEVAVWGNKMRQDRNKDFYEGGRLITHQETKEYLDLIKAIFNKVEPPGP